MTTVIETTTTVLQAVLGLLFVAIGVPKLARTPRLRQAFLRYGYPGWMLPLTGAVEVLGGLALLAAFAWFWLAPLAALWIAATMVGALITHARLCDPANRFAKPAVLLFAAAAVAALRFGT